MIAHQLEEAKVDVVAIKKIILIKIHIVLYAQEHSIFLKFIFFRTIVLANM